MLPPAIPPICAVDSLVAAAAAAPVALVCGSAVAPEAAGEDEDKDELVLVANVELELGRGLVDTVGSIVTEGVM
jgi:hypothetical protein